ncbi:MAG: hypothetical protein ACKOU7_05055 [Ferruginibacter sp.]
MKKLFAIIAITSFLAACNNSGEQKATTTDTSKNAESPLMDAEKTADSVTKKIEDSTHMFKDSL